MNELFLISITGVFIYTNFLLIDFFFKSMDSLIFSLKKKKYYGWIFYGEILFSLFIISMIIGVYFGYSEILNAFLQD